MAWAVVAFGLGLALGMVLVCLLQAGRDAQVQEAIDAAYVDGLQRGRREALKAMREVQP